MIFAYASKCISTDALTIGIDTGAGAGHAEVAQIVLRLSGGCEYRRPKIEWNEESWRTNLVVWYRRE